MSKSTLMRLTGRWISGSMTEKDTIDYDKNPIPFDKQGYSIGIAFAKDQAFAQVLHTITTHALTDFAVNPATQQSIQNGYAYMSQQLTLPKGLGFSWKISDGDLPDQQGKYNDNSKGCFVIWFRSKTPFKCFDAQRNQVSHEQQKRGWWYGASFTCAGNDKQGPQAGVYMNLDGLILASQDQEISGGASVDEMFGDYVAPTNLPLQNPNAPQGMPAPGMAPQAGMPAVPQQGSVQQPDPFSTTMMTQSPSNQAPAGVLGGLPPVTGVAPGMPPVAHTDPNLTTAYPSNPASVAPVQGFANGPQ